jgi:hypothetical protein
MTGINIAAFDAMPPSWWDAIPSYQKINLPKWLAAASDKVEKINVGRHIYVDPQREQLPNSRDFSTPTPSKLKKS